MENTTPVCLVLTTWPVASPVAPFARLLVESRLAACVHVLDAGRSTYRWQGAVEEAAECQLVIKTTRDRVAEIEAKLHDLHPYEVAEFLVCNAEEQRHLCRVDSRERDRGRAPPAPSPTPGRGRR